MGYGSVATSIRADSFLYGRPKVIVKKRLGRSTDMADALALSFAEPVYDRGMIKLYGNGKVSIEEMFSNAKQKTGGW